MKLISSMVLVTVLAVSSCGYESMFRPVSMDHGEAIKRALEGRSFRQFDPRVEATPRKAVILHFFDHIRLWAQYADDNQLINEWKIEADDYRIETAVDGTEIKLYFIDPVSERMLPDPCKICIDTLGISISVRDVFDSEKISFKVNDPNRILPSPFPVFKSWTRFNEDEFVIH